MVAVGPEFFPAQDLGVFEKQTPKRDEVTIHGSLVMRCGCQEMIEFPVARFSPLRRNAACQSFCCTELAEAGNAICRPSPADSGLERTLTFAAPRDAVNFSRIFAQHAFDLAYEMST